MRLSIMSEQEFMRKACIYGERAWLLDNVVEIVKVLKIPYKLKLIYGLEAVSGYLKRRITELRIMKTALRKAKLGGIC